MAAMVIIGFGLAIGELMRGEDAMGAGLAA
jgi:hypothetical protein